MSGMEAALSDAVHTWSLIVPVDVPFLPTALLYSWARTTMQHGERDRTRVGIFRVNDVPQPTLLMIHRDVKPYLSESLLAGRYKLFPVLQAAAQALATRYSVPLEQSMRQWVWTDESRFSSGESSPEGAAWTKTSPAQEAGAHRYFANLNTPEEFAEAEMHADLLDT